MGGNRGAGTAAGHNGVLPACVPGFQARPCPSPVVGMVNGEWKKDGAQIGFVMGCRWKGA